MPLFTLGHPGIQRPQVGDRNVSKRQVMQVAIGAKLRRKGGLLVAAPAIARSVPRSAVETAGPTDIPARRGAAPAVPGRSRRGPEYGEPVR